MEENEKIQLFEKTPIPSAVAKLSIPMVFSSLVMVLYNMADTYFVGMLNNPVENAAVALAAPVLLAFNAINNLFGVGTSSMMSRALSILDCLIRRSSRNPKCGSGIPGTFRRCGPSCQYRNYERLPSEYHSGPLFYPSLGT